MSIGPDPVLDDPTPGMHLWGWMSPAELRWLGARAAGMRSVVEIGSLHGRSGFALGTACPGLVVCIDLWDDPHGLCLPSFLAATESLPNVQAVQGRSPEIATSVEAEFGRPEMTFVDGAHDYDSVIADLDAWTPITTRLICGHDYGHGSWDVKRAVDDYFGSAPRVAPETSIWYVEIE